MPEPKVSAAEGDERRLVEAAQEDPSRFAELYERYFERVYAFIARRVRERDHAEDLTSEVFHRALASLPRFVWRGVPFAAWLFRIASNIVADRTERAAREHGRVMSDDPVEIDWAEIDRRAHLFRLVNRLPADQRRVVQMRFVDEKSIREIAQDLGRSEGAIKQLQFRALKNLRAQIGESDG